MSEVIQVDEASFFTMNMLKRSIKHMKKLNTEGKFDSAIMKEEAILRSFFDVILGRSEAEAQEAAA